MKGGGRYPESIPPETAEKLLEALQAVLPIAAIVLVLCFTIAPVSPSILLCFCWGRHDRGGHHVLHTGRGDEHDPMGERVGAVITKAGSCR